MRLLTVFASCFFFTLHYGCSESTKFSTGPEVQQYGASEEADAADGDGNLFGDKQAEGDSAGTGDNPAGEGSGDLVTKDGSTDGVPLVYFDIEVDDPEPKFTVKNDWTWNWVLARERTEISPPVRTGICRYNGNSEFYVTYKFLDLQPGRYVVKAHLPTAVPPQEYAPAAEEVPYEVKGETVTTTIVNQTATAIHPSDEEGKRWATLAESVKPATDGSISVLQKTDKGPGPHCHTAQRLRTMASTMRIERIGD